MAAAERELRAAGGCTEAPQVTHCRKGDSMAGRPGRTG